jgi:hypothetical protein
VVEEGVEQVRPLFSVSGGQPLEDEVEYGASSPDRRWQSCEPSGFDLHDGYAASAPRRANCCPCSFICWSSAVPFIEMSANLACWPFGHCPTGRFFREFLFGLRLRYGRLDIKPVSENQFRLLVRPVDFAILPAQFGAPDQFTSKHEDGEVDTYSAVPAFAPLRSPWRYLCKTRARWNR